jgi:Trp operon repressor
VRIAGKEELAGTLIELLKDPDRRQAMGERAKEVFDQQAGATARCVTRCANCLKERSV